MKITRNNYEIYFIDWLEGNLPKTSESEFYQFLEENPDLKNELDGFEEITLEEEVLTFEGKAKLKAIPAQQFYEISDIEYLCIADMESDISTTEKESLTEKLTQNRIKRIHNEFAATRLKADLSIIFLKKKQLKKFIVSARIKRGFYTITSIAAAILLYFSIGSNKNEPNTNTKLKHYSANIFNWETHGSPNTALAYSMKPENYITKKHSPQKKILNKKQIKKSNQNTSTKGIKHKVKEEFLNIIPVNTQIVSIETAAEINKLPTIKELSAPRINKSTFWVYTEKTIDIWKLVTSSEIELKNSYKPNGELDKLNIYAAGVTYSKTFN